MVGFVPLSFESESKHFDESGRCSPDRRGSADGIMATFDDMRERSPNDSKKKSREGLANEGVMGEPQVGVKLRPHDEQFNARRQRSLRTALNLWASCSNYAVPLHLASTCNEFAALGKAFDRWQAHPGRDESVTPQVLRWIPGMQGATRARSFVVPRRRVTPTRQRPANKVRSPRALDRCIDVSEAIDVRDILDLPLFTAHAMLARARPPSCLRQDWPSRTPAAPYPAPRDARPHRRDAPYQDWQRALRRNGTANTIARAKDWAYRSAMLSDVRNGTPSKIQPWHVNDGSYSYCNIVAAADRLNARARETLATPDGDDHLGHVLAGSVVTERSVRASPWR